MSSRKFDHRDGIPLHRPHHYPWYIDNLKGNPLQPVDNLWITRPIHVDKLWRTVDSQPHPCG